MPRYANDDNSEIFRAVVIETTKKPGQPDRVFIQTFGPYAERSPASAQITRQKKEAQRHNDRETYRAALYGVENAFEIVVTGRVERTAVNWEEC